MTTVHSQVLLPSVNQWSCFDSVNPAEVSYFWHQVKCKQFERVVILRIVSLSQSAYEPFIIGLFRLCLVMSNTRCSPHNMTLAGIGFILASVIALIYLVHKTHVTLEETRVRLRATEDKLISQTKHFDCKIYWNAHGSIPMKLLVCANVKLINLTEIKYLTDIRSH
jgi:hypothetical protein